jgi:hypothetical protein
MRVLAINCGLYHIISHIIEKFEAVNNKEWIAA